MKLFKCTHCGQLLYFENSYCENCGYELGFLAADLKLLPLQPEGNQVYKIYNGFAIPYRYCANRQHQVCNWLVPANSTKQFCEACELNRTIPDINDPHQMELWKLIEAAKHRLVYTLLQLKLPLVSKIYDQGKGLAFDFLSDDKSMAKVITGHENGLITLNTAEASDIDREMARKQMDESYRTLLGHFRHEVGHYYFTVLVDHTEFLEECRVLFGDERQDYGQALQQHYQTGAPANWNMNFISAYASAHPSEDWAETWAHYLHIVDTLETAYTFGLNVSPRIANVQDNLKADIAINPYHYPDFKSLMDMWLPLTFAMNSLNRSMGQHDLYPFIIPEKVVEKLSFIHKICYYSRLN